jgi:hypothetical protein
MRRFANGGLNHRNLIAGLAAAATMQMLVSTAQAQSCPNNPTPVINSPQSPDDVCKPDGFGGNPIAFFDDYSWRVFLSMVWPAEQGKRGVPDTGKSIGTGSGALVFETFKADWELFQPDGHAPSDWTQFGGVPSNPCLAEVPTPGFDDLILASISKFQNLGEAGLGSLVGPIVAQNKTYVRYMTSFNKVEFDQILNKQWFLRKELQNGVSFSNGSIDVKTSWIAMTNVAHPERFYTRKAWLMNLANGHCSQETVGLVGMHIVQKTKSRPQWIWTSFEHIDNVPQSAPPNSGPTTFNDGSGGGLPLRNPIAFPPPVTPPTIFNIVRMRPINPSTVQTNAAYQTALKGTVWANYELVMTQWPLPENDPSIAGTPQNTFPGADDFIPISGPPPISSGFANTSMETFDQKFVSSSCMACHNTVKEKSNIDFLWSLEVNAFPPPTSTLAMTPLGTAGATVAGAHPMALQATPNSPALRALKGLLESAVAPSGN